MKYTGGKSPLLIGALDLPFSHLWLSEHINIRMVICLETKGGKCWPLSTNKNDRRMTQIITKKDKVKLSCILGLQRKVI